MGDHSPASSGTEIHKPEVRARTLVGASTVIDTAAGQMREVNQVTYALAPETSAISCQHVTHRRIRFLLGKYRVSSDLSDGMPLGKTPRPRYDASAPS